MTVKRSFLISFMVDARGGAMRGCRHSGVRVVIPPKMCSMPTRVTCRLIKKEKLMKPPPMSEGEGLAARILEMGPVGTQFLGPIIMEIPHYASLRGKEREVVVMRSDNGESWYEHPLAATEEAVSEALGGSLEELEPEENLQEKRITRILTTDFPQYFALVTRVKQEAAVIGYEGGVLSSTVVPQVQAVLPEGTLTKPIKVGLQAQPVAPELVAKLLGNRVAVSPIVTVEPRRRKFHKPITLTIPVPKAAQKGMINQYGADRPTLRLLYSLAGNNYLSNRADPAPTSWEDITDNKPITLVNDCVSFTTTVSARFWLIDCQNISDVTRMATALYHEAITVPYMAKFVVFGKRTSMEEGRLRMFCMTDDKVDKTLEKQEKFVEIARSRDIEVLEGRPQYIEMAGNLIPVTKSGDQLHVNFKAFRENRLPSTVKIRDPDQEAAARVAFMKEPKLARGEAPQIPICNLNIRLPDTISSSSSDVSSDTAVEIQKRHSLLREQGIVLEDTVTRSSMNLSDVADNVQGDWVILAQQLGVTMSDINRIKTDYTTLADQALAMLQLWVEKSGEKATGNTLEMALQRINREDVVKKCMYNTEVVDDEVEAAAARVAMDQSGFDTFKEEVGITKDSMKRGMSLDVQYDEQDMIKESESAEEESSPGSDRGSIDRGPAPQAIAEERDGAADDEEVIHTPPPSPTENFFKAEESEEYEEERTEEFTEIIETFQSSDDGGKTWKTYKKIIRITPEGTSENVELVEDEPARDRSFAAEAATRLASDPDSSNQVLPSLVSGGRGAKKNQTEEKRVTFSETVLNSKPRDMEDITFVGPERDEVEVKEESEILPDGTVHSTQRVSQHKVKHVCRTHASEDGKKDVYEADEEVPGTSKEDVYEMFEQPPKLVQESEEIEQVLDDGRKVKKHIVMNRMVHHIKMHHESFDEEHHKLEEDDYEIEEVIPGTESAFVADIDSDSEEEGDSGQKRDGRQNASDLSGRSAKLQQESNVDGAAASPKLVAYVHGSDVDDINQFVRSGTRETTLDVVEDMLAKGQLTLDDLEGDDIEGTGSVTGDDDNYIHRVVMKKEVHQKTMIRADGQEETVIKEDSQVHQDSEPPEALRDSMQQIIHQFMEENPQVPTLPGEEEGRDEGTEV